MCNELAHFDWDAEVFSNLYDINAIYSCWFKHFHDIVKTKIPSRIVMIRPRDKPWMDSSVRLAMRKRDRLLKYRQQRNLTTTLIRKNKAKYFHKVNAKLQDVTTGVKAWWSIVKGLYGEKVQSTVSTLIEGVRQVTNAQEKAEILNEHFCDQSKVDDWFASLPRDSFRIMRFCLMFLQRNERFTIYLRLLTFARRVDLTV